MLPENEHKVLSIAEKFAPNEIPEHMYQMFKLELQAAKSPITEQYGYGWMTRDQWSAHLQMLEKYKVVSPGLNIDEVFTTKFL